MGQANMLVFRLTKILTVCEQPKYFHMDASSNLKNL